MANNLLTPSMITRFSIRMFLNTNYFLQNISRQFEDQFGEAGAKIGAQLRIRYPNQYTVTDGPGISVQDTIEQQFLLTVATQRHVDVAFTSAETTLDVDDYMERIVLPRVNALAANVAVQVMANTAPFIRNITANVDGANNILPVTDTPFALARAVLEENSAPNFGEMGMRKVALAPRSDTRVQLALRGLLNPVETISRQFNTGMMYEALQFRWFEDQSVVSHTTGSATSATVNGANQTGNVLTINALTGTINQGDVFTLAGVNAVNRANFQSLGTLAQFVAVQAVAAGATTITMYPPIIPPASAVPYAGLPYTPQQYQTVTASPANNATLTPFANASVTYRENIAYVPDAITLVVAPLWIPPNEKGVIAAARHEYDDLSMRSLVTYEPSTDQPIDRLDILFGSGVPRPEWGVQVADSTP
ncbi:MAG: P22 phage major capsid protein family protein [Beijerinckiaceae bacterium]|nr:P22 phage major capsid protein family protein [Beijerinckiaceae bacterium]